jgi:hypothetical protein
MKVVKKTNPAAQPIYKKQFTIIYFLLEPRHWTMDMLSMLFVSVQPFDNNEALIPRLWQY